MCASCHDYQITGTARGKGKKGIDFLAVPELDVAILARRGVDIGEWPVESEAELTGFMRALIATEPRGADIVTGVSQLDLTDLAGVSDEELGTVKALAWAVKKLFSRLESTPLSETMTQLPDNRDGTKIGRLQRALFTGLMPHDVIMMGNSEWFPNLKDDLERFIEGNPTKEFAVPHDTYNRGTGQSLPSEPQRLEQEALELELIEGEGEILSESDGDILGELDGNLEGSDALAIDDDAANSALDDALELESDDDAKDDALTVVDETSQPDGRDGAASSGGRPAPQFDPESWAEFGGWYRQDFTIRYRPYGHSTRFLQTWLDYSGQAFGTGQETLLAPIFDQLADSGAVGRCTKCHSVDNEGGSIQVKWRAHSSSQVKNRFTTFSHAPHISTSGNESCMQCHKLRTSDADYLKTYSGGLAGIFEPNFTAMDKAVCSSCHTQQTAGETCTQCHNYHATE